MNSKDCPVQNFVKTIEELAAARKADFAKMSIKEKAEKIYYIASTAGKRDDIRDEVAELAIYIFKELAEET